MQILDWTGLDQNFIVIAFLKKGTNHCLAALSAGIARCKKKKKSWGDGAGGGELHCF